MKKRVKRATKPKGSKRTKSAKGAVDPTHAIVFKYSSTNNKRYALKKVAAGNDRERDVYYYAMQGPMYYTWSAASNRWKREKRKKAPVYRVNDRIVFVFHDRARQTASLGVAIDFAQAIAPLDDEVAARVRMAAALERPFVADDDKGLLNNSFALAWDLDSEPWEGFELESEGRFDYAVSLLSFSKDFGIGDSQAGVRRYWHDPEMDIGN